MEPVLKKSKAVCILGMHRSGTSTITRAVNLLGAYLGEDSDLMPPAQDNPEGYWERQDIADLDDEILHHFKRPWDTGNPLPNGWHLFNEARPYRDKITALIKAHFSGHELWAWKDPRTSVLFELWRDVLKELGIDTVCLIAVRNPLDVARSLEKRDGFPRGRGYGIWFNYNIAALKASAGLQRVFLSYDRFLDDWETELKRCADVLGIEWPEDASFLRDTMKGFIRPNLRHSHSGVEDLLASGAPEPVVRLYRLLESVTGQSLQPDQKFNEKIDALEKEFSSYARFYNDDLMRLWALERLLVEKEALLAEKERQLSERDNLLAEKDKQLAEKDRTIQALLSSMSWKVTAPLRAVFKKETMDSFFSFITKKNFKEKEHGCAKEDIYDLWIKKNEPEKAELEELKKYRPAYKPKISFILRSSSLDEKLLKSTISSMIAQTYSLWELYVVDCNAESAVRKAVRAYFNEDNRLKFVCPSEEREILLAGGEFISFIKQGDSLAVFALSDIVSALNKNQDADLIYSDEDIIDSSGKRNAPFFKPDWSPDYFLSCNYINHLAVIRKSLVKDMSSEYDLLLRVTESAKRIVHIPEVLYHSYAADTAPSNDKQYEERDAIASALRRRGLQAEVLETQYKGFYRVKYQILKPEKVSIIIPTKDKVEVLKKCVDSVLNKTTYNNYEIIIIDNGSMEARTFEYYKTIESDARVKVLKYDAPFNYSKMNNYAVRHSTGYYLLFLNNDTEVISPAWMESMIELAQRKTTGVVGAKLLFSNNTIQHAGVILGIGGAAGHSHRFLPRDIAGYGGRVISIQNLSAVTGACMMVRKEVFEEVGGFDENLAVTYNDVELCVRIKEKGFFVVYTPFAELYHYECYTRGHDETTEKQLRCKNEYDLFKNKWGSSFANGDPFYSPNLTLLYEDFSIKI